MKTCTFEGCERAPVYPDQNRCEDHRLRWLVSEPAEQRQPEWLRRKNEIGLPAKDMTGHAA